MKMSSQNAGFNAEQIALTFLTQKGLKLLAQNYHCRFGELDLVMQHDKTLVFIEVRKRTNTRFGSAAESITPQKQQKIMLTAQHYLQTNLAAFKQTPLCRFDVVLIENKQLSDINWLQNAFSM
jgi:putative endonuclease